MQIASYVLLWNVSRGKNSGEWESEYANSSEATAPPDLQEDEIGRNNDFSFVALEAAMYLMLTIAKADLWDAVALLLEGPVWVCTWPKVSGSVSRVRSFS